MAGQPALITRCPDKCRTRFYRMQFYLSVDGRFHRKKKRKKIHRNEKSKKKIKMKRNIIDFLRASLRNFCTYSRSGLGFPTDYDWPRNKIGRWLENPGPVCFTVNGGCRMEYIRQPGLIERFLVVGPLFFLFLLCIISHFYYSISLVVFFFLFCFACAGRSLTVFWIRSFEEVLCEKYYSIAPIKAAFIYWWFSSRILMTCLLVALHNAN